MMPSDCRYCKGSGNDPKEKIRGEAVACTKCDGRGWAIPKAIPFENAGLHPIGILDPMGRFYPIPRNLHVSLEEALRKREFGDGEGCRHVDPPHSCRTVGGTISHPGRDHDEECLGPYYGYHYASCLRVEGWQHISVSMYMSGPSGLPCYDFNKRQTDAAIDWYLKNHDAMVECGCGPCLEAVKDIERKIGSD